MHIGLTGGIGSGKSTVAAIFSNYGIQIIDADQINKALLTPPSPYLEAIAKHFGSHLLTPTGELDRRSLRSQIFSNKSAKKWLEQLLHPPIIEEIKRGLARSSGPYNIVVIPLLNRQLREIPFDRILLVDANEEFLVERARVRDNCSVEEIQSILASQPSRDHRLKMADDVIINDSNLEHLSQEVEKIHEFYLTLLKAPK